jgi:hypothetical protein
MTSFSCILPPCACGACVPLHCIVTALRVPWPWARLWRVQHLCVPLHGHVYTIQVSKEAGESHSLLVYADAASRAAFQEAFAQQAAAQPASSNGAFVLRLPSGGAGGGGGGGLKRGSADAEGGAGGVNGNADGGRPVKQQRTDIRDVVSPWWSRPYKEQLDDKMTTVERALRLCSERVGYPLLFR